MTESVITYSEGDCFLVPLRDGDYARGIVARRSNEGILFGYFFPPRITSVSEARVDNTMIPENAILCGQFGDLGLLKRKWVLFASMRPWTRDHWPMPPFLRIDESSGHATLVYYDEDTLSSIREEVVDHNISACNSYPKDSVMGYGFVEIKLSRLLPHNRNLT